MKEIKHNSFVTYATVAQTIEKLLEQNKKETASELAISVIQYGIYGEYDSTDPTVELMMISLGFGIDKAQDRYQTSIENGKNGGRPKTIDDEQIGLLRDEGLTNKEIANKLNISISSVEKANRKNRKNQKNLNDNYNDNYNLNDNDNININNDPLLNIDIGEYSEIDYDLNNLIFKEESIIDPDTQKPTRVYVDATNRKFIYKIHRGKKLIYRLA